jgi:hypothetical protein
MIKPTVFMESVNSLIDLGIFRPPLAAELVRYRDAAAAEISTRIAGIAGQRKRTWPVQMTRQPGEQIQAGATRDANTGGQTIILVTIWLAVAGVAVPLPGGSARWPP